MNDKNSVSTKLLTSRFLLISAHLIFLLINPVKLNKEILSFMQVKKYHL